MELSFYSIPPLTNYVTKHLVPATCIALGVIARDANGPGFLPRKLDKTVGGWTPIYCDLIESYEWFSGNISQTGGPVGQMSNWKSPCRWDARTNKFIQEFCELLKIPLLSQPTAEFLQFPALTRWDLEKQRHVMVPYMVLALNQIERTEQHMHLSIKFNKCYYGPQQSVAQIIVVNYVLRQINA